MFLSGENLGKSYLHTKYIIKLGFEICIILLHFCFSFFLFVIKKL